MAGWHSAGFFTHNLLVKRGFDASFIQLGMTPLSYSKYHFFALFIGCFWFDNNNNNNSLFPFAA